jgi:chromosome segregation ATPase
MTALQRARFDAARTARLVADLASAIEEMKSTVQDLERSIAREEERTRNHDATRSTYSPAAAAARDRVHALQRSLAHLATTLAQAQAERDRAAAVLAALEVDTHRARKKR